MFAGMYNLISGDTARVTAKTEYMISKSENISAEMLPRGKPGKLQSVIDSRR